jgi:hypothetical protein
MTSRVLHNRSGEWSARAQAIVERTVDTTTAWVIPCSPHRCGMWSPVEDDEHLYSTTKNLGEPRCSGTHLAQSPLLTFSFESSGLSLRAILHRIQGRPSRERHPRREPKGELGRAMRTQQSRGSDSPPRRSLEMELGAGEQPRATERSKNPEGSAAIRGKPILPLRKTLERRAAHAKAWVVESA